MPIPQPKDNEKQNDYMGRCMHKVNKDNPKMENKQQVAICLNTYNNPKQKSKAADREGIEIDFTDKIKEIKEKKAQEEAQKQMKIEPVIEQKVETPAPVVEVKAPEIPVVEPVHTAVTAPTEVINEVKVEEAKQAAAKEIKAEVDGELIQTTLLQMQHQYKILHWQTTSFSQHKSFDEIVSSLIENTDEFIETYMGKYGRVIAANTFNINLANYKDTDFVLLTNNYIGFLIGLNDVLDKAMDSDLLNIRDEIFGSLNQLKYLLTLV